MPSDKTDISSQRAILSARIAASAAAETARDADIIRAQREFASAFLNFFSMDAASLRLGKRTMSTEQLLTASREMECWWATGGREPALIIGFSSGLVLACADSAITHSLSGVADATPTVIDRFIASTFARRIAAMFAAQSDDLEQSQEIDPPITALDTALSSADHSNWRVLSFAGDLPPDYGGFSVVVAQLESSFSPATKTPSAQLQLETPFQQLQGLTLNIQCHAARVATSLARALSIKVGDVIAIDWAGAERARLMVGGQEFAVGALGEHNGHRGIRIANASDNRHPPGPL